MKRRWPLALAIAVLVGTWFAPPASAESALGGDADVTSDGDGVLLTAREAAVVADQWRGSDVDPELRLEEYKRTEVCALVPPPTVVGLDDLCTPGGGRIALPDCGDEDPLLPLWRRTRVSPVDSWGPWVLVAEASCPLPATVTVTVEDFRRLPLVPSVLWVQPDRDRVLVNMPTITLTDPSVQVLTTTVLGRVFEVEATPVGFTWDYGDGTVLSTTSPGHAYPEQDVFHVYASPGTYTIRLTTTWAGRYRTTGTTDTAGATGGVGGWVPVVGTATTTSTHRPIQAMEVHTELVAGP